MRRWDPLILSSGAATLFLAISDDPWWTLKGASTISLLSVQVSPYYIQSVAAGLAQRFPFAEYLGLLSRVLLFIAFGTLLASSIRPSAWWRDLAVYFGLSALIEQYLSFLLNYHAVQTLLLGGYGIIPPVSGTSSLPTTITGLDFKLYTQPLVAASFSLPFYVGLLSIGLVCGSVILSHRARRTRIEVPKGLEAIFTPEPE